MNFLLLLLGDELDKQVQVYITSLMSGHAVVSTTIVLALAEGIINPGLLASNGGSIELTRDWAKSIMKRMGLSKRKATTKSTLLQYDFDKVYLNDIASIVVMEDMPLPLVINWDQTGTNYVPVSEWTMEVKGAKRVEIGGLNNNNSSTSRNSWCRVLPPQLIYSGSTVKSLPKNVNFPVQGHITNSLVKRKHHARIVINPYVEKKREELKVVRVTMHAVTGL